MHQQRHRFSMSRNSKISRSLRKISVTAVFFVSDRKSVKIIIGMEIWDFFSCDGTIRQYGSDFSFCEPHASNWFLHCSDCYPAYELPNLYRKLVNEQIIPYSTYSLPPKRAVWLDGSKVPNGGSRLAHGASKTQCKLVGFSLYSHMSREPRWKAKCGFFTV